MTRASRLLALRVLFSLAVLAVLIHQFGGGEIADIMLSCDPLLFAAAVALFLVGQWLNALRWRMLLIAGASRSPPLHDLYALIMAGSFFNFFLPSTVGGDLFRAELARHHVGGRRHAYGSIVVGRLLALLAVLALAAGGLAAWLLLSGRPASGIAVVVTGAVFAVLSGIVALGLSLGLVAVRGGEARVDAGVLQVLAGCLLVLLLYGPIGLGVGALVRNQVAAVVVALAWVFVVEQLLVALLPEVGRWTPGGATAAVLQLGDLATLGNGELLPAWAGALLLVAYALLLAGAGARTTLRRDLT